jgi:hypothetical protein
MRIGTVVFVLATLAVVTVAAADTDNAGIAQVPGAATTAAAPTMPANAAEAAASGVPTAAAQESPAGTPSPGSAAPESASAPQPVELKMASVPPPAEFKIPAGYRAVKRGLDTVYCTTMAPTGTRLSKTYCMTMEQVEHVQRQAELDRQMMNEKARVGPSSGP